jgi:hypothetical protein
VPPVAESEAVILEPDLELWTYRGSVSRA